MTDEATQAPATQMDDDLINYEVDDIDLGVDTDAAAASLTTSQMMVKKTTADLDEIDWEDHDNIGVDSVEINGKQDLGADANAAASFDLDINGLNPEGPKDIDAAAASISKDATAVSHDLDIGLGDAPHGNGTGDADWDEYNDDDAPQETKLMAEDEADESVDPAETGDDVEAPGAQDDDEYLFDDDRHVEVVEVEDQSDEKSDEEGGSPVDDVDCPDITVTYKNEEFPLFHGQKNFDNQDGFFDDQSILDVTIDQLLGKFREELASDLGPQDEMVLQIDEMGLEYAESTQKDHCVSVTLRQIHEIFEQLSKNQDPDATRTLYTNLIIRLHPAKRLDLLINEAFNGKGLDDVTFSLQSGQHDGGRPAPEQAGNEDMYGDSSDVDEDGSGAQDDEQDVDEDDEGQDEDAQDEDDQVSRGDLDADADNVVGDGEEDDYGDNAEDDMVDMVDLDDDNAPTDEYPQQDYAEEDENGLDTMNQPAEDVGDDAYDPIDYEGNQAIGDGTDANDGDENAGLDLLDFGEDDVVAVEPDQPDKGNTSATVTLNGDGDNEITYEDDGVNGTRNHAGEVPGAAEGGDADDGFDEIDWRDGPDDEAAVSKETVTTPAKRPYSEVEVDIGLEDEGDAKRQRA